MTIRDVSTARLREYENNPRNNDLAVEKVKYSIERFGFLFPVVIDMNYTIVCGHTRVRACKELGILVIPCIMADELTDEQINLFRLVDNKTSEYSDWDFEKLKEELSLVDLTLEKNQLLLDRFELSAEVFDIDAEQAEIKIPAFNFMGVNDKPKKPPVKTIDGNSVKNMPDDEVGENDDEDESGETMEGYSHHDTDVPASAAPAPAPASASASASPAAPASAPTAGDAPSEPQTGGEQKKESKAAISFNQFRFGDVAFYISQVELDRLNEKYAEYIDSGAILGGSFADYLLKGVEKND